MLDCFFFVEFLLRLLCFWLMLVRMVIARHALWPWRRRRREIEDFGTRMHGCLCRVHFNIVANCDYWPVGRYRMRGPNDTQWMRAMALAKMMPKRNTICMTSSNKRNQREREKKEPRNGGHSLKSISQKAFILFNYWLKLACKFSYASGVRRTTTTMAMRRTRTMSRLDFAFSLLHSNGKQNTNFNTATATVVAGTKWTRERGEKLTKWTNDYSALITNWWVSLWL